MMVLLRDYTHPDRLSAVHLLATTLARATPPQVACWLNAGVMATLLGIPPSLKAHHTPEAAAQLAGLVAACLLNIMEALVEVGVKTTTDDKFTVAIMAGMLSARPIAMAQLVAVSPTLLQPFRRPQPPPLWPRC